MVILGSTRTMRRWPLSHTHRKKPDKNHTKHSVLATSCNILQHLATSCNILQHLATSCNILQLQVSRNGASRDVQHVFKYFKTRSGTNLASTCQYWCYQFCSLTSKTGSGSIKLHHSSYIYIFGRPYLTCA